MDRRRQTRYDVGASVLFTWKDELGVEREGKGLTRDISMGGVFVLTEKCPPCGTRVHMIMRFPKGPSRSGVLIEMDGLVLRIEPAEGPETIGGFTMQSANLVLLQEKLKTARPRKILEVAVPVGAQAKSVLEEPSRASVAFDKRKDREKARSKKQWS